MDKATLRKICKSFKSCKCPEYRAFKQKVVSECGISYETFFNYTCFGRKSSIPKLVQEKITEIIHRDYPEQAELLNQLQQIA